MEPERTSHPAPPAKRPAYVFIADSLRAKIESQELVPGDRLPSERELVDEFDVARMTVRHALELLQEEGIIERRRGRSGGTFVRALAPTLNLNDAAGLRAQLAAQKVRVSVAETAESEVTAPPAVELAFGLASGAKVQLREVVYAAEGGAPLAVESTYRPLGAAAQAPTSREDIVASARPTERERNRLDLGANATLQRVTRRVYAGGELAELTLLAIRSDAARLKAVTELQRL